MSRTTLPSWQRLILRFTSLFERDWFCGRPDLDQNESVLYRAFLGRVDRAAAHGGTLYVTTSRILFLPNRAEKAMGQRTWQCLRSSVLGVEPSDRGINPFAGSLGQKFRVVTTQKPDQIFVAYDAADIMNKVRDALG